MRSGEQTTDSLVVPPPPPTSPRGAGAFAFLDSLGDDAKERPHPSLRVSLAGGGGLVAAAGVTTLIVGDDASQGAVITAGAVALAIGLAIRLLVRTSVELRSAAVALGAVGIVVGGFGIAGEHIGETWSLLLVAALALGAWAAPGFRGRPLMLGVGTLMLVFALGAAISSQDCYYDSWSGEEVCNSASSDLGLPRQFGDVLGDQSAVFLIAGAALFALVWVLDRRGYRGVATPLIVSALLSALIGTGQAFTDLGKTGPAILILAVGVLVCLVGNHGDRRATTWWGAGLAIIGAAAFWIAAMKPSSTSDSGTALLFAGASLVVVPLVVRAIKAKSAENSQAAPPNP